MLLAEPVHDLAALRLRELELRAEPLQLAGLGGRGRLAVDLERHGGLGRGIAAGDPLDGAERVLDGVEGDLRPEGAFVVGVGHRLRDRE